MLLQRTLTILSYNAWMLDAPFNLGALHVKARSAAIPAALAETGADVIALQEVWSLRYKTLLAEKLKEYGYEYSYYENIGSNLWMRGLFGNGLMVVSKIPLIRPHLKSERVISFQRFTRLDEYFAGKGALRVDLQIKPNAMISFYNTHLGAVSLNPLVGRSNPRQEQARLNQAEELFNFIKSTHKENPIIVAGDFNTHHKIVSDDGLSHRYAPDYQNLTAVPYSEKGMALVDSYHFINGESSEAYTHDTEKNLYSGHRPIYRIRAPRRTLDYIYVSQNQNLEVCRSEVVLTENVVIPGREQALPLSDHFGILTHINLL